MRRMIGRWWGAALVMALACTGPMGPKPSVERTPSVLHSYVNGTVTYYHSELSLRPGDLIVTGPVMERELAYQYSDGGQFEIFVRPELIPATTPECPSGIIVRMPWTNPKAANAEVAMEQKKQLLAQIMALRHGSRSTLPIVIELNPYVEVSSDVPPKVSLTQCNVLFRHANEVYVDRVGALDR